MVLRFAVFFPAPDASCQAMIEKRDELVDFLTPDASCQLFILTAEIRQPSACRTAVFSTGSLSISRMAVTRLLSLMA